MISVKRETRSTGRLDIGMLLNRATLLFGLSLILLMSSRTVADPDLWGHLRFGLDHLSTGRIVRPDIYSFLTGDQLWYNHEWLAEAIFALVYQSLGSAGLVAFKMAVMALIALLMYRSLRSAGITEFRAWVVIAFCLALAIVGSGTVRPQLFTFLGFAITLRIMAEYSSRNSKYLLFFPPLFVIWTNSHGGFLAGIAVLMLRLFVELAAALVSRIHRTREDGRAVVVLSAAVIATLLATLINPYGIGLWRFLLETATVARPEISEWQALSLTSMAGKLYLALLIGGLATFFYSRNKVDPFRAIAFVALGLAPMLAQRHAPLFAIALPILAAPEIKSVWDRGIRRSRPLTTRSALVAALALILTSSGFLWWAGAQARCIQIEPNTYPITVVELLKEQGAQGNMAVHFNWGEYALWHLGPNMKVSIDGRRETVYSPQIYLENLDFMDATGVWDALFSRATVDYALVPAKGPTANLLKLSPGWALSYEDNVAALFSSKTGSVSFDASKILRPGGDVTEVGCFR